MITLTGMRLSEQVIVYSISSSKKHKHNKAKNFEWLSTVIIDSIANRLLKLLLESGSFAAVTDKEITSPAKKKHKKDDLESQRKDLSAEGKDDKKKKPEKNANAL